jgi:hypothetical protein
MRREKGERSAKIVTEAHLFRACMQMLVRSGNATMNWSGVGEAAVSPFDSEMRRTRRSYYALFTFVFSAACVLLMFVWQGWKGFSLWDEGFLWYGAQRVVAGEIPVRDFMSYDPGRYYWCAAFMLLLGGRGIVQLRAALALFQVFAVFVAFLLLLRDQAVREKIRSASWSFIVAATLLAWMFPRHKLIDVGLSIFLIGVLSYLLDRPEPRRYFLAGLAVGLVAVFGRNHGVYGAFGSAVAMLWLVCKSNPGPGPFRAIALWALGVGVGFSPILIIALAVPGFAQALWQSIRFLVERQATNVALPTPWPWTLDYAALPPGDAMRGALIGMFFIGCLAFGCAGLVWALLARLTNRKTNPTFVASACLALPYAQFAFSRADVSHLAQGAFPLLIGSFSLLSTARDRVKWPLGVSLCLASVWVMLVYQPGWQCKTKGLCVKVAISGSQIWVDPGTASDVALLRRLADEYAPDSRSFIAAPFWPGAYALMERRSPMWEIYALFPRSGEFEDREIERVKAADPGFVVLLNSSLDGREALRFRNTHPRIQKFIEENFDRVTESANSDYEIFKKRRF